MKSGNYWQWYRTLRKQGYSRFSCLCWAWYNSRHYDIDGMYK